MAMLVLLNGPPGVGKSTMAKRFVADRSLSLNLDIDVVRGLLGRWLERPKDSGLLARDLATAMATTTLAVGHDVVVPQYVARSEFIERLAGVAAGCGATFSEVVLMDDKELLVDRFQARSASSQVAAHQDAAALNARAGGVEELGRMYDELVGVIADRPQTIVVRSVPDDPDTTYARLVDALGGPR